MDIRIIGKLKSRAVNRIIKNTNLCRYSKKCDIVVNYGLAGKRLDLFCKKHPSILRKPMINKYIGCNKYKAVKEAKLNNIKVPITLLTLSKQLKKSDFLTKQLHSQGGKGIEKAKTKSKLINKYYQEFITTRKYELRVHAFAWLKQTDWLLQKRFGKKEKIAWNYSKGGTFKTINNASQYPLFKKAKAISEEILKIRNMAFGAVDFIITSTNEIIFLEINSAPGFTKLSEDMYIKAFDKLTTLTKNKILKYCN